MHIFILRWSNGLKCGNLHSHSLTKPAHGQQILVLWKMILPFHAPTLCLPSLRTLPVIIPTNMVRVPQMSDTAHTATALPYRETAVFRLTGERSIHPLNCFEGSHWVIYLTSTTGSARCPVFELHMRGAYHARFTVQSDTFGWVCNVTLYRASGFDMLKA